MTQYNDTQGLSQQISELRRQIMQLMTQPRATSTGIDRGGTQSSDYDGSDINTPGTVGWKIGTDEATGVGYVHINGQNIGVTPAATYKSTGIRSALAASTWHDLPIDTLVVSQGTLPWGMNNNVPGGSYRIKFTQAGFYTITATGSIGAANFALRLINLTTGQVNVQTPLGNTTSNTNDATTTAYFSVNDESVFQIYYPATFSTIADNAGQPTRLTISKV